MFKSKMKKLDFDLKLKLDGKRLPNQIGVISIFLRAIVLQTDSPTERTNNPAFRVDSPTKLILVVFSPTNRWSYSPAGLSIRWSRPLYRKSYFM